MYAVDLYSASHKCAIESGKIIFEKYKHLLTLKNGSAILEIGTGDGSTTAAVVLPNFPKNPKEVILSDKSEVMLAPARKMKDFAGIKFEILDVEREDVPEDFKNRFDTIFSMFTFHWIRNTRQAIHNLYKMLKPGGELFAIFFCESPADFAWDYLSKNTKWKKYVTDPWTSPYYQNPNVLKIYLKHLEECGFSKCLVEPEDFLYDFEEQEFKDLLVACNISMEKIPKEFQNEYLEEYFEIVKRSPAWYIQNTQNVSVIKSIFKLCVMYAQKPVDHL